MPVTNPIGCNVKWERNDTIVIWGSGRIGHCILQAVRTKTENTIFMIDVLDNRLEIAGKNFSNIITINPLKELIWKEAKIIASRVTHGEFPEAIKNLAQGKLKPDIIKKRQRFRCLLNLLIFLFIVANSPPNNQY